jgi:hypothetical protein
LACSLSRLSMLDVRLLSPCSNSLYSFSRISFSDRQRLISSRMSSFSRFICCYLFISKHIRKDTLLELVHFLLFDIIYLLADVFADILAFEFMLIDNFVNIFKLMSFIRFFPLLQSVKHSQIFNFSGLNRND